MSIRTGSGSRCRTQPGRPGSTRWTVNITILPPRNRCKRPSTAESSWSTPSFPTTCTAPGNSSCVFRFCHSATAALGIFRIVITLNLLPSHERSLKAVQTVQKSGKICVLDIDMQGVIQIKKVPNLKPVGVFIRPPSIGELEVRLRRRASESETSLRARLNAAQQEINYGECIQLIIFYVLSTLTQYNFSYILCFRGNTGEL